MRCGYINQTTTFNPYASMALLSIQNAFLNLGGKPLLDNAELHIERGERLCLVGRNGAGKSSLLSVLAGFLPLDAGELHREPGLRLGYVQQAVPEDWQGSVFSIVASALGSEGKALATAHLLTSGQGNLLSKAERDTGETFLQTGDGWERYGDVQGVINSLGLNPEANITTLSGGTRRRVALARALMTPETLLLDEPTNHLDISTIAWLEEYLTRQARTLIFISHDRAFVRRLATRIVELDRGKLYSYACGFDTFLERREDRLAAEDKQAAAFDKKLAQEEAWIRQGIKARRTRNMGRVRELEQMRKERAARRARQGNVTLNVQEAERSGKLVIEASHLSFTWPDGFNVIKDLSLLIQRGDRVGIIGDNGTGKTTLLRLLLGELQPTSGVIRHGTRLEVAYFDQLRDTLDPDKSVMNSLADGHDTVIINGEQRHVAGYLRDFLFDSDKLRIPVRLLSGGERNRLLLARLFTRPSNLLVLDEPTNDLDVETLELLEDMLANYTGTVLVVSHDRAFLDNLVTSTIALEGHGIAHEYVGGYTDWLRQRGTFEQPHDTALRSMEANNKRLPPKRKLSFKEQREQTLLQEELSSLPEQLAALEEEQAKLTAQLSDPDFFSRDPEGFNKTAARISSVEEEQMALLERWEAIETRLKELAALC